MIKKPKLLRSYKALCKSGHITYSFNDNRECICGLCKHSLDLILSLFEKYKYKKNKLCI